MSGSAIGDDGSIGLDISSVQDRSSNITARGNGAAGKNTVDSAGHNVGEGRLDRRETSRRGNGGCGGQRSDSVGGGVSSRSSWSCSAGLQSC